MKDYNVIQNTPKYRGLKIGMRAENDVDAIRKAPMIVTGEIVRIEEVDHFGEHLRDIWLKQYFSFFGWVECSPVEKPKEVISSETIWRNDEEGADLLETPLGDVLYSWRYDKYNHDEDGNWLIDEDYFFVHKVLTPYVAP